MKFIKILVISTLILIQSIVIIQAKDYSDYQYTDQKGRLGIAYELIDVNLDQNGLYFSGWGYIPETSHYNNNNILNIDIMVYESSGEKYYYDTMISNKYDLTEVNKYVGVDYCNNSIHFQEPTDCNYYYKNVSFEVQIPLSVFQYPYEYEFYLYIENKETNTKRYTKLYSPDTEDNYQENNLEYNFTSDVDDVDLKLNSEYVYVRNGPGKDSSKFSYGGYNYYFQQDGIYKTNKVKYDYPTNWYQVGIYPSNEINGYKKIAKPDHQNSYTGWASSIYFDFLGPGNSKLTVSSKANVAIDDIYSEIVIEDADYTVGVDYRYNDINADGEILAIFEVNGEVKTKVVSVNDQNIEMTFSNVSAPANVSVTLMPANNTYYDSNDIDNNITALIPGSNREDIEIDLQNNQTENLIEIKANSGYKITLSDQITEYYETIEIYVTSPITSIQDDLQKLNSSFEHFYAGGVFNIKVNFKYSNNYPYMQTKVNDPEVNVAIDCDLIDLDSCTGIIPLEKNKDEYTLPIVYRDQQGKISYDTSQLSDITSESRVIYTKFNLDKGKHPFEIQINNLGLNQIDVTLNSYIDIHGNLIGMNRNDLFYIRGINRENPFPNHMSRLWANNQGDLNKAIEQSAVSEYDYYIEISKSAKKEIKDWIEQSDENLQGNNQEFIMFLESLEGQGMVEID